MDSEDACAAIANNELELAVVTLPELVDEKLHCEAVWIDQLVAVLAADHSLSGSSEIDQGLLLEHPAILPSKGTFTRKIIDRLFAANLEHLKIVLETNYLETIKVMVSANLGWSILPLSMVDNNLIHRRLKGFDVHRPLGIVTRKKRTLSISSSAMIELLRENSDKRPS